MMNEHATKTNDEKESTDVKVHFKRAEGRFNIPRIDLEKIVEDLHLEDLTVENTSKQIINKQNQFKYELVRIKYFLKNSIN